jgi:hypothetical protein
MPERRLLHELIDRVVIHPTAAWSPGSLERAYGLAGYRCGYDGAAKGTRTPDPRITKPHFALYAGFMRVRLP